MVIDIKELLKAAEMMGWSDRQICKAAGRISHTTLWRWRRGDYSPRLEHLLKLRKALNA